MEEKEWEEEDDEDYVIVDITAVKLFGMPDEAFLIKETDNNKKKEDEEDEKSKGDGNDGGKNSSGGVKRGKNMRGGIDRYASKGDNKDDADAWYEHDFNVEGKEGAEWENTKGKRTMTKRARRRRRRRKRKKRGGGSRRCQK